MLYICRPRGAAGIADVILYFNLCLKFKSHTVTLELLL